MRIRDLAELAVFVLAVFAVVAVFFGSCYAISESQQQSDECDATCAPSRAITPIVGGQEACICDRGNGVWQRVNLPKDDDK